MAQPNTNRSPSDFGSAIGARWIMLYGVHVTRDVCVLVPVLNDASALPGTIDAIRNQTGELVGEIVLAVGPSTDDTRQVAEDLAAVDARIQVIDNPSGRTAAALNLAIQASTSPIVARVDARAVVPPSYIEHAVETLRSSGAANVGAIQNPVGTTPVQRAIAAAMSSPVGSGGASYRYGKRTGPVDTAWLGVFQRSALEAVGGFDEEFTRNQDAELNARLRSAGHEVWLDRRLTVDYGPRMSFGTLSSQFWQYGWWRVRTILRHRRVALRQLVVPVAMLALVACLLLLVVDLRYGIVPLAYVVALSIAAIVSRRCTTIGERTMMVAALAIMHASWAAGFLTSLVARPIDWLRAKRSRAEP